MYGLVQWQENVAIVTEYLPSGNLMELLSDEVVDIRSFLQLRMGFEIANGLACMHNLLSGQRLVHGDIKAENVLLTDDLHCKIADFGSSILSNYTNNITTNKGEGNYINEFTAIYAAPELLKNNAMALRPSNDTYSFAMILYLILTRKSPVATSCLLKVFLEDVKQGKRPRVDVNTLTSGLVNAAELVIRLLYDVMVKCWTQEAAKRPEMKTVRDELYERMTEIPPHQIHSQVVLASSKMTIVNISKKKHKCVPIDHLLIELSRASNVPGKFSCFLVFMMRKNQLVFRNATKNFCCCSNVLLFSFLSPIATLKPGLHEPQLLVEKRVTLVSSIEVERRHCALQVSSVARLQENKER